MEEPEVLLKYLEKVWSVFMRSTIADIEYKHTYKLNEDDKSTYMYKGDPVSYYMVKNKELDILLECKYVHPERSWGDILSITIWKNNVPIKGYGENIKKSVVIEIKNIFNNQYVKISQVSPLLKLNENKNFKELLSHLRKLFYEDLTKRIARAWDERMLEIESALDQLCKHE